MMQSEESIYNIIPPAVVPPEKPPMYRSKHAGTIPPTASTFGQAGTSHPAATNLAGEASEKVVADKTTRSMGKHPGSHQPDPQTYLKRQEKTSPVKSLKEVKKELPHLLQPTTLTPRTKPMCPSKADPPPVMGLVTSKNFVVANAVETILAAPKKPAQATKDYLHKEDYGKVPKYLSQIKADINDEYEYIRQIQAQEDDRRNGQSTALGDEERYKLIEGLKAKWEQVNTDYQATTHLTKLDTIGKVKRKEKYESTLQQIEKDIEKLNRKNIYIDQLS
jgi:hypothetical protein